MTGFAYFASNTTWEKNKNKNCIGSFKMCSNKYLVFYIIKHNSGVFIKNLYKKYANISSFYLHDILQIIIAIEAE